MTVAAAVLVPAIQSLLQAQGVEDVRAVAAHATKLVTRYETLPLYEVRSNGALEAVVRQGGELGAGPAVVARILLARAIDTSQSVSMIDRFLDRQYQPAFRDKATW